LLLRLAHVRSLVVQVLLHLCLVTVTKLIVLFATVNISSNASPLHLSLDHLPRCFVGSLHLFLTCQDHLINLL